MAKLRHRNKRLFWHLTPNYMLACGFCKVNKKGWVHYTYSDLDHQDQKGTKTFAIPNAVCYNKLMFKIFNDHLGDIDE